jgi:hypothetical protein
MENSKKVYSIKNLGLERIKTQRGAVVHHSNNQEQLISAFKNGIKYRCKSQKTQVQVHDNIVQLYMNYNKLIAYYSTANKNEIYINLDTKNFGVVGNNGSGYKVATNFKEVLSLLKKLLGIEILILEKQVSFKDKTISENGGYQKISNTFKAVLHDENYHISSVNNFEEAMIKTSFNDLKQVELKNTNILFTVKKSLLDGRKVIEIMTFEKDVTVIFNKKVIHESIE